MDWFLIRSRMIEDGKFESSILERLEAFGSKEK
jgi:hypothetical protein